MSDFSPDDLYLRGLGVVPTSIPEPTRTRPGPTSPPSFTHENVEISPDGIFYNGQRCYALIGYNNISLTIPEFVDRARQVLEQESRRRGWWKALAIATWVGVGVLVWFGGGVLGMWGGK